ncbi:TraR/DksA C4-type zinc finger protein [Mesorhizobium sp. AR07]|uniref:TraR/DksA C4-type zinc finger protein n=1 Tax=Mesorhizobium sp. AR07 TaxID=2865838 RepID=UPI00215EC04F|nr:TraR/DksA C4-type zinc finger protein [Mesorhizobium sp. AR07]UVK45355.1 TraR/DksA C4-type zinc finger protein [Mesorhizobium sp. AR07]
MSVSNRAFELADRRAEEERAAGIRRVQQAIRSAIEVTVSPFCDCGEPIPDARRQAVPNAIRCIDCETFVERQNRRSA